MDSLKDIVADKVMDMRGLTPPMPLIKTRKALARMKKGTVLEIWCSDPHFHAEISKLETECACRYLGHDASPEGYTRCLFKIGACLNKN